MTCWRGSMAAKKPDAPERVAAMRKTWQIPRSPLPVEFEAPIKTVSEANVSQREKWWVKDKRHKEQRRVVALTFRAGGYPLPLPLLLVTLTRIAAEPLDDDNLRPALKSCRDEVAFILGVDDRSPLVEWEYKQAVGEHTAQKRLCRDGKQRTYRVAEYRVRVRIETHPRLRFRVEQGLEG